MKKIFALICAGIVAVSISACSGGDTPSDDVKVNTESSIETTKEADSDTAGQETEVQTETTSE